MNCRVCELYFNIAVTKYKAQGETAIGKLTQGSTWMTHEHCTRLQKYLMPSISLVIECHSKAMPMLGITTAALQINKRKRKEEDFFKRTMTVQECRMNELSF